MSVFYKNGKKYNALKNGKPYFRITATIAGKRRTFYGDGEKDAMRKMEEAKDAVKSGLDLDARHIKVGQAFSHWLYDIKRVDAKIKPSTFAHYECMYRSHIQHSDLANIRAAALSSAAVQNFVNELYEEDGLSNSSIRLIATVLKMFTRWATDEGYCVKDPCRNITMPGRNQREKPIETFSADERAKIRTYMADGGSKYDAIISLAFQTGMRMGELLGLKWSDIYDDAIHVQRSGGRNVVVDKDGNRTATYGVSATKTVNADRTIPLNASTKTLLSEHRLKQRKFFLQRGKPQPAFVFATREGTPVYAEQLRAEYKKVLRGAGVPYRKFHAIRHTFATEAIRCGVEVEDLRKLMGHSTIQMTYRYVQSSDASRRSAVELIGSVI